MNHALAPAFDHYVADPIARHVYTLFNKALSDKTVAAGGTHSKIVRLLAASPGSPVAEAFIDLSRDLAIQGFDFRLVFTDRGHEEHRNHLVLALERARVGLARKDGVLRVTGTPVPRKLHESLVLGDRFAWIGAPVAQKWETETEFGQTIQRPSAVHLAAMGFDSLRAASEPWRVELPAKEPERTPETVIQSLCDWRPGENR